MGGMRARLAEFFALTGVVGAWQFVRGRISKDLVILAYHRVLNMGDEKSFAGDPELVSAGTDEFARQMEYVRRHFVPMGFSDVIAARERGRELPRRAVVVTFDDGHRDNYTNAFPILKALDMPATIFLSTGYVGTKKVFWFERVVRLMLCAPQGRIDLEECGFRADLGDVEGRRRDAKRLLEELKHLPNEARLHALRELEAKCGALRKQTKGTEPCALDWSQVREMATAGIEFGSHAVTHPILSMLDDVSLKKELTESRARIRRETGREAYVLAYPVGVEYTYDDRVVTAARDCGYRLGISYVSGINRADVLDEFALKRLHVERYVTHGRFRTMLCMPGLCE